jgi:hypothetical protein
MADVLYIVITVAFFAVAVAFVQLCDKVIGPDAEHPGLTETGAIVTVDELEAEPATPTPVAVGADR